jgi:hypothetical protein
MKREMPKLIWNERHKMAANMCSNLSVAALAGGFIVPAISKGQGPFISVPALVIGSVVWFVFFMAAHFFLSQLKE